MIHLRNFTNQFLGGYIRVIRAGLKSIQTDFFRTSGCKSEISG